jgi:hypothetical protein
MALDVRDWAEKEKWDRYWRDLQPGSDYILQRDNVLRLNGKNGREPKYISGYCVRPMKGSTFHMALLMERVGMDELGRLYPDLLKTTGRLKKYSSDPNGVFEMIK